MSLFRHMTPNKIAGANAGWRLQFAEKSRVVPSPRPGVAQLDRWAGTSHNGNISDNVVY